MRPIGELPAWMERIRRLLPGLWTGALWCVALIATPAPFATLARQEAGLVVGHIFAREAALSLAVAMVIVMLERRRAASRAEAGTGSGFSGEMALALGAVFCTVFGYYGLQPLMAQAKAGTAQGPSFGQLHALSLGLFGLKLLLTSGLAWRAAGQSRA